VCNVFSRKLNVIRRGTFTQLKVIQSDLTDQRPIKLWTSEANKIVLKGQKLSLKCIFGGLPKPDVTWRKIYGAIPEKRSIINLEKQELVINDLQYEDSGVYECRGHNGKRILFLIETFVIFSNHILELGYEVFSINVQVEAEPYWIKKPKDINVAEGETIDFTCNAESRPALQDIQWFINGIPLQDVSVPYNPRRIVRKNRLTIQNAIKSDTAVYQCNVSNIHGYIFANFFANVICKSSFLNSFV
jgi:receptor-type tyrosine-protein phosphatase zeta